MDICHNSLLDCFDALSTVADVQLLFADYRSLSKQLTCVFVFVCFFDCLFGCLFICLFVSLLFAVVFSVFIVVHCVCLFVC